jgi:hypothetical protein
MDDDNTRAKKLFSQNLGLEKELRNLLKKKNPLDKDLITLRETLRDNYEKIIFLDYDLATSKEVEQSLWKVAFYKVIEEFRVQIRKVRFKRIIIHISECVGNVVGSATNFTLESEGLNFRFQPSPLFLVCFCI